MANLSLSTQPPVEPHNLDAERAVLGACLIDRDVVVHVAPMLGESDFFLHAHRVIYRAILDLWKRRQPADIILVIDELRRTGTLVDAGYEDGVTALIVDTPTSVHANYYAGVVATYAARRRFGTAANVTATAAYDDTLSLEEIRERAGAALQDAARMTDTGGAEFIADVMQRQHDTPTDWSRRTLPTGLQALDQRIGGTVPGQLVIVAARPSMGKTSFVCQVADHSARAGRGVLFLSLEMMADDIGDRFVSLHANVNMHRYRMQEDYYNANLSTVTDARGRIAGLPLRIRDSRTLSGERDDVVQCARREMVAAPYDLLIVDYIGLMTAKSAGDNRAQELGAITRSLKLLAGELGIVVMAAAQLNRSVEQRHGANAWPMLSDLRDSGAVEQDADLVMFLHRAERSDKVTRCDVAKHRNGPVGFVELDFIEHRAMFDTGSRS